MLVVTGNREFTAHGLRVRGFLDRLHEIFDDNVNVNVIESVEQYELTYDGVLQQVRQNPRRAVFIWQTSPCAAVWTRSNAPKPIGAFTLSVTI